MLIDVENVPLRTTLRLLLAQAGMEFSIKNGTLIINKSEGTGGMVGQMRGMGEMMGGMMGGAAKTGTDRPRRVA